MGHVIDAARLAAVASTKLLDTPAEESFDRLARLARGLLGVPYAFITVVDDTRSFWKSCIGVDSEPRDSGLRQNPVEESFCQYVIEIDGPLIIADTRLDDRTSSNPSIETMNVLAWAGFPLRSAAGLVLGTFCAVDVRPHDWTTGEIEVLSTLAAAAESEIGLRTALEAAQTGRAALEWEMRRSQQMATLIQALSGAESTDEIGRIVTEAGARLFGAQLANIAVLDDARRQLAVHHPAAVRGDIARKYRVLSLSDRTALTDAINSRRPILIRDPAEQAAMYPHLADDNRAMNLVATAAVPLLRPDGSAIGALGVGWDRPNAFEPSDVALLMTVAATCASAIQRAQLGDLRGDLVRTLQRELLPATPNLDGLDVAVRYLPSHDGLGFGGDWYDVIDLGDGRVAVVVGDIAGHGIQAAARMAQVRAAINALIRLQPDDLSHIFDHAERMLEHLDEHYIATVSIAVIDTAAETITYVSAGHPPALLLREDGDTITLEAGRRRLLGLGGPPATPAVARFAAGDTLLSFTDGLVETRTRTFDAGTHEVAVVARRALDAGASVEEIADAAVDEMLSDTHVHDDVAVVVIRSKKFLPNGV